jgi:hypothetical protein
VTRREQLGSLAASEPPSTYPEFEEDLLACSARVVSFGGDSDLIFLGRSPDALFHFLAGALLRTSWADRLSLLDVSLRGEATSATQVRAFEPYLAELGLGPEQLVRRARPAAFVDVVDTGGTFGALIRILHGLANRDGVAWKEAARKLRVVGITWRTEPSPKTWRWHQQTDWVDLLERRSIKNVSAPPNFATYLAASAPKMTLSYRPRDWGDPSVMLPLRDREARDAVALALHLFDLGRSRDARRTFARELARQPAMRDAWFRSLVLEVKR